MFNLMIVKPEIHVVLVEPEIPPNTGNIGRTCLAVGGTLHLVGELGFSLSNRELKRAGLDYWPNLAVERHSKWDQFLSTVPEKADLVFFSTRGRTSLWERAYTSPCYLVFGSESRGFPRTFYELYRDRLVRIPVQPPIRSLNLSTAAGVAIFEALRQLQRPGKQGKYDLGTKEQI